MKKTLKKSLILMLVFSFVLTFPVFAANHAEVKAQDRGTKVLEFLTQRLDRIEQQYTSDVVQVDNLSTEEEALMDAAMMEVTGEVTYTGNPNGLIMQIDALVHIFRANLAYFDLASDEVQDFINRLETLKSQLLANQ